MTTTLSPASFSPRFTKFFGGYSCRLMRKKFASVRIEKAGFGVLQEAVQHEGPLVIAMNHPSWWDPIVGVVIRHTYFPDRPSLSPIEMKMYDRFKFMRKLGLFGIDPDHRNALREMVAYVRAQCDEHRRTAFFITPQGAFTDVRKPIVVRPGVGAIASTLDNARVLVLLSEFSFWHDKRPEAHILIRECEAPMRLSTASWTRAIRSAMQTGADDLADLVIAREETAFSTMLDRSGAQVNPLFDLWQRLRGRRADVTPAERGARA